MATPSTWSKPKHFAGTERAGEGNHTGHGTTAFKNEGASKSNPFASKRGHRIAKRKRRG